MAESPAESPADRYARVQAAAVKAAQFYVKQTGGGRSLELTPRPTLKLRDEREREWEQVRQDRAKAQEHNGEAILIGNRIIIGDKQIVLELQECAVVEALVKLGAASLPQLKTQSGYKYPAKALKRLIDKHADILRAVISLPGGRGRGGYSTSIKLASTTV